MIKLRKAKANDLEFLYNVSTVAMRAVGDILDANILIDQNRRFAEYKEKFDPNKVEVITYNEINVGRLRVVRNLLEIYIGGIQILPEFQGLGIGTKIFQQIISEADDTGKNIRLEVHKINIGAIKFYKNLGLNIVDETDRQYIMTRSPKKVY